MSGFIVARSFAPPESEAEKAERIKRYRAAVRQRERLQSGPTRAAPKADSKSRQDGAGG